MPIVCKYSSGHDLISFLLPSFPHVLLLDRYSMQPISRTLTWMHIRNNVNDASNNDIHDQMRKSTDRMCTLDTFDIPKGRKPVWRLDDVPRSLLHFGKEFEPETRRDFFVVISGLLELHFRFGLNEKTRSHRVLSFASIRSNTSSAGLPNDRPSRTNLARCAISASHSEARFATDALGAMASMTTLRSSSVSSAARAMTSRTAALDMTK